MKKLVMMFAAATVVMMYGAEAEDGLVRVRENVMPVRNQRDLWAVGGGRRVLRRIWMRTSLTTSTVLTSGTSVRPRSARFAFWGSTR